MRGEEFICQKVNSRQVIMLSLYRNRHYCKDYLAKLGGTLFMVTTKSVLCSVLQNAHWLGKCCVGGSEWLLFPVFYIIIRSIVGLAPFIANWCGLELSFFERTCLQPDIFVISKGKRCFFRSSKPSFPSFAHTRPSVCTWMSMANKTEWDLLRWRHIIAFRNINAAAFIKYFSCANYIVK